MARNGALTLDTNRITPPSGTCTLATTTTTPSGKVAAASVGLPITSGAPDQPGFPWLPVVLIAALLLGLRVKSGSRTK